MRYLAVDIFQLFMIEQKNFERRLLLRTLIDRLLDSYSRYLKTDSRIAGLRAIVYARRIHTIDPNFKFALKE